MAQGDRGNFDRNRNARMVADALAARQGDTNRVRNTVFDALAGRVGAQTAGTLTGVLDFLPGVGEASGAEDAYQAAKGGDYKGAAIAGAATLLGLVPGVGDAASRAMRSAPDLPRGYARLYHGTSKSAADEIINQRTLRSAGEPRVYLTTDAAGAGYGDGTVVEIDIPERLLEVDDEFPDGRIDYSVDVKRPGGSLPVRARIFQPKQD